MPNNEPGMYRYRIRDTHGSSERYGNCEVCGKPARVVWYQVEERAYYNKRKDKIGWTQQGCRLLFGHRQCLLAQRQDPKHTHTSHSAHSHTKNEAEKGRRGIDSQRKGRGKIKIVETASSQGLAATHNYTTSHGLI